MRAYDTYISYCIHTFQYLARDKYYKCSDRIKEDTYNGGREKRVYIGYIRDFLYGAIDE